MFSGDVLHEVFEDMIDRNVLGRCHGVPSGYMRDDGIAAAILDAVAPVRAASPKVLYCGDGVIGDVGRGAFVRPGMPQFMAQQAVPVADFVTPDQIGFEIVSGRTVTTLDDALAAPDEVYRLGPRIALVICGSARRLRTASSCRLPAELMPGQSARRDAIS